jgi:hypothetical protein
MATKLALFIAHAWKVGGMSFQEHPSNGARDAAENILCSPSKGPFIIIIIIIILT